MKIVSLKTHVGLKAGSTRSEVFFTTESHTLHKGLVMTLAVHPQLGGGVMIETTQLKAKGSVSFCPVNNVEEIVFANDEAPKGKK